MVQDIQNLPEYFDKHGRSKRNKSLIGEVTQVYYHDSTDDDSNHEVNVRTTDSIEEFRRIPVHVSRIGDANVPQIGDVVEISFSGRDDGRPFVSSYAYTVEERAPLARPGQWRKRFGDSSPYLFIEAERSDHVQGTPDVIRLAEKADGLSDPTTKVEVDASGGTTKVNIETDGDITISAGGDVLIDEGGTATPVARQNHDHDYSWTDAGGSGTTSTPNQSGTNTEIE